MADLVDVAAGIHLGIKPEIVVKGGFIVWGAMGDSAASLMTCEPLLMPGRNGALSAAPSRRSAPTS